MLSLSEFNALKGGIKSAKIRPSSGLSSIVDISGQVTGAIVGTLYGIRNEKLRGRYADELDKLTQRQASELEEKVRVAKGQNERLETIAKYLSDATGTKISTDITKSIDETLLSQKRKETKYLIWGIGGVVGFLTLIILLKKITK